MPSKPKPKLASRSSTQAHTEQIHTQIGAETVNPSPRRANPSPDWCRDCQPKPTLSKPKLFLFFLLWRTEGENGEQRESIAKRRKKKWKREKKIGQNEREKKKKSLNRPVKNNKIIG
jgi:hypothetical protein